jgi:hypothetical protein
MRAKLPNILNMAGLMTRGQADKYAAERASGAVNRYADDVAVHGVNRANAIIGSHGPAEFRGGLLPFPLLRVFSDECDVVRGAIQKRIAQVMATNWHFIPAEGLTAKEAAPDIEAAKEAWSRKGSLGGPGKSRREFISEVVEDLMVCGAAVQFRQPNAGEVAYQQGRVSDPKLARGTFAVVNVDAATVKPILSSGGWVPVPPAVAYEQYIWGAVEATFTRDELRYTRLNSRTNLRWSRSPVDHCLAALLMWMNQDLRVLTELVDGRGSIGHWEVPEGWSLERTKEFSTWINALMDTPEKRAKGARKAIPVGPKWVPDEPWDYERVVKFQNFLVRRVAGAFDLNPAVLGYAGEMYKVAQEEARRLAELWAQLPLLICLEEIQNEILHDDLGLVKAQGAWDVNLSDREAMGRIAAAAGLERMCTNDFLEAAGFPLAEGDLANAYFHDVARGAPIFLGWRQGYEPKTDDPQALLAAGSAATAATSGEADPQEPNGTEKTDSRPTAPESAGSQKPPGDATISTPKADAVGDSGTPANTGGGQNVGAQPIVPPQATGGKAGEDLRRWRDKALRFQSEGRLEKCHFDSTEIPAELAAGIQEALGKASSAADVEAAFGLSGKAAEGEGTPGDSEAPPLLGALEIIYDAVKAERAGRKAQPAGPSGMR